jgi:hypothetical protein
LRCCPRYGGGGNGFLLNFFLKISGFRDLAWEKTCHHMAKSSQSRVMSSLFRPRAPFGRLTAVFPGMPGRRARASAGCLAVA